MAVPQPGVWGIDLGQCALKAVRLENIDGTVTATAFDFVEHPKILSQPDADPDQLTREALEKFLSRNNLKGDIVAMSIPGQSGLARFVKLPPVEEKKITEIVKFEAKQQIPFNLEEVVWDYQRIGSSVVTDGFAMETEIGLFAIKREMVYRALQHFQEVHVELNIVQMAPLSLCNYAAYDLLNKDPIPAEGEEEDGKKQCVVVLDIGVETSNLVITDGERIIWQRPIPIGGNRFTRALTKDLKLTFAKAEHLKKNATKSPDLRRILMALKPDLSEFVNEVQKSLNFFTNSHRDAHIQYLMGLGSAFKLPGLQKYLNEKLQLEVRKLQKFNRLSGESVITAPVFTDNVMTFAVAYGLALQGLKQSRLQTNLLPQEIRMERLIRAKKPWAVGAAAALLLGAAGLTLGYKMERDAVASPVIHQAQNEVGKKALDDVVTWERKVSDKQREYKNIENSVKSIIAGQEERLNWLKINKYINDCLPYQTDKAGNLTPSQKTQYWSSKDSNGKEAYEKYAQGQDSEEVLKALVQINLEAVNSMYTEDLSNYFKRMQDTSKSMLGMSEFDQKHPPKPREAGWVVELRGYTYHSGSQQFVLDTFVDNLATHAAKKPGEGKEPKGIKNGELDPLTGRISHVVLYRFPRDEKPVGAKFHIIDSTVLPNLVAGVTSGVPSGGPPDKPGQPGTKPPPPSGGRNRDGWRPLGTDGAHFGRGGDKIVNTDQGEFGKFPKKDPKEVKGQPPTRTEFIILFVWREPTPTDAVESSGDGPPATTRTGPPPKEGTGTGPPKTPSAN
ncbi:MAG: type IV pilus assembly protein PilM [Gemmataceae bacterium]|nr:type IV pilus assembly protein PilM [Gemmataceae bacterium]